MSVHSVQAQPVNEDLKISAADGAAAHEFGNAAAISQGVIAVGAHNDDDNGLNSGSAYLYNASTGAQMAKLLPSDGAAGDQFGFSIDISGGVVAVGAPQDDHNGVTSGSVYLFSASTGAQLAKLTPNDADAGDQFGTSVAIDGGIVAVGATNDVRGNATGSAYLFDAATGAQLDKIFPSERTASFGVSIAMDAGTVAVGSRMFFDINDGFTLDAVYLFDVSSGNETNTLRATNGTWTDMFATCIDIDNGLVAVGAWGRSIFFDHSGAAYVFDASTGNQLQYIFPSDGHDRDNFGNCVSIDNGVLAIGAHQDGDNGFVAGSAYLFDANTGNQIDKLLASDGAQFDNFGTAVAIENDVVVIGAVGDADNGADSGSVYVFGDSVAPACPADANADGAIDVNDISYVLFRLGSPPPDGDTNADGAVDVNDITFCLFRLGNPCH